MGGECMGAVGKLLLLFVLAYVIPLLPTHRCNHLVHVELCASLSSEVS